MPGAVQEIDQQQDDLMAYLLEKEAREQEDAAAEQQRQAALQRLQMERQLRLEATGSAIYLLSTLVGFQNAELGKTISVMGNAAFSIAQSISKYATTAATLGTLGASLGSVVLTGNVVAAALSVASLFGSSEPTPERMILEEISKLRRQVERLRAEMHDRFDRIDQTLNAVYGGIIDVMIRLDAFAEGLEDVEARLVELQSDVSAMGMQFESFIQVVEHRPLVESINRAIGYRKLDRPRDESESIRRIREPVLLLGGRLRGRRWGDWRRDCEFCG